jgi:hypothetical protein
MRDEPGQRRGLLLQGQGVEHLRLYDAAAREADQVQAVVGGGDRQVLHLHHACGGRPVFAQRQHVGQVGGDTADVLGVRVDRREGHLHRQRALGSGGHGAVDVLQSAAGGQRREPGGEGAGGTGRGNGDRVVPAVESVQGGGGDPGGDLHMRRRSLVVEAVAAGEVGDHLIGEDDLPALRDGLPGQGQQPLIAGGGHVHRGREEAAGVGALLRITWWRLDLGAGWRQRNY